MAHPGGRPTKYNQEIQELTESYIENYGQNDEVVPTICGLACFLEISKSTIYKWAEENKKFSDTLARIKQKQENVLINKGLDSTFQPTIAKLMTIIPKINQHLLIFKFDNLFNKIA